MAGSGAAAEGFNSLIVISFAAASDAALEAD